MNGPLCPQFHDWLDRLPRRELSPAFREHMAGCPACRRRHERLDPVTGRLGSLPAPMVPEARMKVLVHAVRKESLRSHNRRLAIWLIAAGFACLPLIVLINWVWAAAGYTLLVRLFNPVVAWVFLGFFISSASVMAGISYVLIPLLTGWLQPRQIAEETDHD